jgi:hypothetical protein
MATSRSDELVPADSASALLAALTQALPRCLEILAEGHRARSNIAVAVRGIEVGHELRMQAVDEIERMLGRYLHVMSADVRDAYFTAVLRLLDGGHYELPWAGLLPRR